MPANFIPEHLKPALTHLVQWSERVDAATREVPLALDPGEGEGRIAVRGVEEIKND